MRRILLILVFILLPIICSAQFIGIATQYVDARGKGNALQFAANLSYPVWHKKNKLNSYLSSGIDYTGGSSPVAGLNIQPIQFRTFFSEKMYNEWAVTILAGFDAGYLVNHRHGENGIVLSPNLYIDYKFLFVKIAWDFNVTGRKDQFYVRAGFSIGLGTFKIIENTKIW